VVMIRLDPIGLVYGLKNPPRNEAIAVVVVGKL